MKKLPCRAVSAPGAEEKAAVVGDPLATARAIPTILYEIFVMSSALVGANNTKEALCCYPSIGPGTIGCRAQ